MPENETEATVTKPARVRDDGVALVGDYPLNRRLRAEALAADGVTEDPEGLVDADTIADAGTRAAAEDAARAKAEDLSGMTRSALDELAASEGVDTTSARNKDEARAMLEDARSAREAGTFYNPTGATAATETSDADGAAGTES